MNAAAMHSHAYGPARLVPRGSSVTPSFGARLARGRLRLPHPPRRRRALTFALAAAIGVLLGLAAVAIAYADQWTYLEASGSWYEQDNPGHNWTYGSVSYGGGGTLNEICLSVEVEWTGGTVSGSACVANANSYATGLPNPGHPYAAFDGQSNGAASHTITGYTAG